MDGGIRTRARARAKAEQWSAVALPQKLAMLLADALLEHSEGYGPAHAACRTLQCICLYWQLHASVRLYYSSMLLLQGCTPVLLTFQMCMCCHARCLINTLVTGHGQAGDLDVDSEWEEVSDYDSVGQNDCAGGFGYVPACNP